MPEFPGWPALDRLRRRTGGGDEPGPLEARWSFGGGNAFQTSLGLLFPEALVAGAGHGRLDAFLAPSGSGRADAVVADLRARLQSDAVTGVDDRGARYTLRLGGASSRRTRSGELTGLVSLRLRVDPVPERDVGWLELRGQDAAATRLLRSARPAVRVGQVTPAAMSPDERERSERALSPGHRPADDLPDSWSAILEAAGRTDWARHHLDIDAALPPVGGVSMRIDTLICLPGGWRLHLRARPGWWYTSRDGRRKRELVSVHAEDDLGGAYLSRFGGGTGHLGREEELTLRFQPRLDPLARTLKLMCRGASEEVIADLDLREAVTL